MTERQPLVMIVVAGIQMNVVLAVFNFVPIPPLDGSKVASYWVARIASATATIA
jgi:Zn-dependent protease